MIRMFALHKVRKSVELESMWEFATAEEEQMIPSAYKYKLPVPGCWESHPELQTYRGIGWYRKRLYIDEATGLRLEFKGISHTADVYFDGALIAQHYNAYTPFSTVLPFVDAGEHELLIKVDNRFTEQSTLHVPNDYYTYGGMIRPVVMDFVREAFVERIWFTPMKETGGWRAEIKAKVVNLRAERGTWNVRCKLGELEYDIGQITLDARQSGEVSTSLSFPHVQPWSDTDPNLYLLEVQLCSAATGKVIDDLIERVGFRQVEVLGDRIVLNGQKVKLKGFCRHEDHPAFGAALPVQQMVQDMELMRELGCNAVRTSHYPNDERFLDLCDEYGMLVWEENHARGLSLEQMLKPGFREQCLDCNREMVENHYNHPSIVIWGILNECASDTEQGRAMYKEQLEQIRAMDASRPLSFASHLFFSDLCLDLADIISFNVYPGWYNDDVPGDLADRIKAWADEANGAGKPMIISEFGADGYYGYRSGTRVRGTEERQSDIVGKALEDFIGRDYIQGLFIWQFCDVRVTEGTGWLLTRARTMNSKGIFDEYRRPKLAAETVKHYFRNMTTCIE
ncbi:glycoside hydrolase family 2 protein [Marinicrinis lubricantis]|uniref:Glycoside hydrolase family 2 protein n=1 Tax=Marinicrinis lubricantis TaxID=2086470 RepID=A0ABW1IL00_9BACL